MLTQHHRLAEGPNAAYTAWATPPAGAEGRLARRLCRPVIHIQAPPAALSHRLQGPSGDQWPERAAGGHTTILGHAALVWAQAPGWGRPSPPRGHRPRPDL